MTNYQDESLWRLSYHLQSSAPEKNKEVDPFFANKLESIDDLYSIQYYISYKNVADDMPETKEKINKLFAEEFAKNNLANISKIQSFRAWISDDTKKKFRDWWITQEETSQLYKSMSDFNCMFSEPNTKILEKLLLIYKSFRKKEVVDLIEKAFINLPDESAAEGCELLYRATPAISVLLLKKNVGEKYSLKGLKSLAKLSKQRDINVKINFAQLESLGPRGRLDAIKQLMGMYDEYYKYNKRIEEYNRQNPGYANRTWVTGYERRLKEKAIIPKMPFETVPTKEEIDRFLFPCSLLYNSEVLEISEKFSEFLKAQEQPKV